MLCFYLWYKVVFYLPSYSCYHRHFLRRGRCEVFRIGTLTKIDFKKNVGTMRIPYLSSNGGRTNFCLWTSSTFSSRTSLQLISLKLETWDSSVDKSHSVSQEWKYKVQQWNHMNHKGRSNLPENPKKEGLWMKKYLKLGIIENEK